MSLAARLLLLVVLALVGLGAAITAAVRIRRESSEAREEAAFSQGELVTRDLLARRAELPPTEATRIAHGHPASPGLEAFVKGLVASLVDGSAGYCTEDGALVVQETILGPGPRLPPPRGPHHEEGGLLPFDREAVEEACRKQPSGTTIRERHEAPTDLLFVTVAGTHEPFAAWVLIRSPRLPAGAGSLFPTPIAVVIGLSMLLLVALSVETILRMRQGIDTLASALVAVQSDLKTPIPQPRALELARVAEGLRALTAHLSESRERELALERKLAHERRLASLGRVTAGVAHEIRNPLAGMKLRLDSMARRSLDERSARDVNRSLGEVARLDAVVSALLLIARKEPAPQEEIDVAHLLDERIIALEGFASARGIHLRREGAARARIDPAGLARALDNLMRNGVEASPSGATVYARILTNEATLLIEIEDPGPGVSPAREGELFEPFFTSKPDGTGLGLSLARAAVEAHGGTLTYRRENEMTRFLIQLPGSVLP